MFVINEEPFIYSIDNFITDEECKHIIEISKDKIIPSLVSGEKEGIISTGRTSKNCWIDHNHDEIVKNISQKIAKQVNMPLENAESLQVIYYDKNQEYKQHYDGWLYDDSEKSKRNMKFGGQRILTALVYLNKIEEGGGTRFTRLNKDIYPEKGKLLIFSNVYKNTNLRHELSEHAGLPVIEGEKWAFNLWFREENRKTIYDYDFNANKINNRKFIKNYKNSMNNEWREWVKNKLENNENIELIRNKLIKQNYNPELINEVLKKNTFSGIIQHKFLELGDYFPFIKLGNKEIYNLVDSKNIILIILNELTNENINFLEKLTNNNYHFFVLFSKNEYNFIEKKNYINLKNIPNILDTNRDCVYILNANRRIINIVNLNEEIYNNIDNNIINDLFTKKTIKLNVPYLIIENVLDDHLLNSILDFYDKSKNKELHNTNAKNRLHVHPDSKLEILIDNKLSRSLFPEIKKIYDFDVEYREIYKICSYDSNTNGRFAEHRDTPFPNQHRKYALSLILNNNYEGGELYLPEYNEYIKPKANSAIVFPGICSHQVMPITNGSRKTIISFFCNKKENDSYNNERYRVKSNFFKEHNIEYSLIYPN